jgi:hypothetical protein
MFKVLLGVIAVLMLSACSPEVLPGGTVQKFSSKSECQSFHLGVRDKLNYPELYSARYVDEEMKYTLNGKDLVIFCLFEQMVVYPEGGWIKAINERNAVAAKSRDAAKDRAVKTVEKYGY